MTCPYALDRYSCKDGWAACGVAIADRKQALQELLAKVEAGRICTDAIIAAFDEMADQVVCLAAFDGSLDAAKALHDAVLPGWLWGAHEPKPSVFRVYVSVRSALRPMPFTCDADNPARAWLSAIIKALISECKE